MQALTNQMQALGSQNTLNNDDASSACAPWPARLEYQCLMCAKSAREADLGVLLVCKHSAQKAAGYSFALPEIELLEDAVVCRLCYNEGVRRHESGAQDFIVRAPDGRAATHWMPLYLRESEHWMRSVGPQGTLRRGGRRVPPLQCVSPKRCTCCSTRRARWRAR